MFIYSFRLPKNCIIISIVIVILITSIFIYSFADNEENVFFR